eukprot:CAMPEP_0185728978 /NCGR_PEP_ID=MMETSP1171-20130828/4400_1 /TAXON_ID=374046 /ORGANISM="Helicotheca tamensis, Strain CCMP826" /LENGTH=264 /DNA_ID=CAMNT_0028397741 /DNA_START=83 /DNA_END=877 /DNA_ORIENTATION=+
MADQPEHSPNPSGDLEAPAGSATPGEGAHILPPDPEPRSPLKAVKNSTPMEKVAGGVAGTSVITSVTAMILEGRNIVYVAGGLSSVIGPYAYWQQTRLTDIAALKQTHEAIQREVDRLASENERLHQSVEELSSTVDRLEDVEQALDVITQTQGQSVDAFAEQVKENREILSQMQKNLRANVLQNLLSVIIRSDTDQDFQINENELDDLINRIKRINGCELHEDRFRKAIMDSGGSLQAVMDVVKNLLSNETTKDDEIFTIVED